MRFGMWTLVGQSNHVLDGVEIPTCEGVKRGQSRTCLDMCGNRYAQSNSVGGSTGTCVDVDWGGAHWRHLANATEPSMCGSDAALCQITLFPYFLSAGTHMCHFCTTGLFPELLHGCIPEIKPESPTRGLRSSPPACTASLVVGSSKAP